MEILNDIPDDKYVEVDEFLAYIGIYDDIVRLERFRQHLSRLKSHIEGKTVVEAGAGFGLLSREILKLNPRKLFAVERNDLTYNVLKTRLADFDRVETIHGGIEEFEPDCEVDLLVHEFYGSMLYDENLFSLQQLRFQPKMVFPNGGELRAAVVALSDVHDDVVDTNVLRQLDGVVVGDLFPDHSLSAADFDIVVARYAYGEGIESFETDISRRDGELVAFSLFITHDGEVVCDAITCENWSIAWTPRSGDMFRLDFEVEDGAVKTIFQWLK